MHPGARLGRDAGASRATAMMSDAVSRRADELSGQGVAFVTATVVRAQRPASARAGNSAIVLADGSIEGFVGGVCAEQSVRAYSLRVLESGEPVLLRILPDADGHAGEEGEEIGGGTGRRDGPEPVPVGRGDRGLPRAGAALAMGPGHRRGASHHRRRPDLRDDGGGRRGTPSLDHEGETVYFCCEGCRTTFVAQHEHAAA